MRNGILKRTEVTRYTVRPATIALCNHTHPLHRDRSEPGPR